ncbi:hypothetical protein, partial [Actinomadura sp. KC216]|uniref:hypothetical protein n=1 Tax=Actinomadura sp. KC216 TaxID=2530370 RepID=UPI001A9CE54E
VSVPLPCSTPTLACPFAGGEPGVHSTRGAYIGTHTSPYEIAHVRDSHLTDMAGPDGPSGASVCVSGNDEFVAVPGR